MESRTSKNELRRQMRTLRGGLPASYRREAAWKATQHALRLLRGRKTVAVYLANGCELATTSLILALMERGHHVCAPRLEQDTMVFARIGGRSHLRANRFGILEPLSTPKLLRPDAVVMPLLAFDTAGRRLGQGGGHYDRALARSRPYTHPLRVGLGYALQQVDCVPAQLHDVRMHAVVTEQGVQWPTG